MVSFIDLIVRCQHYQFSPGHYVYHNIYCVKTAIYVFVIKKYKLMFEVELLFVSYPSN
jgi:hypothetical protein